MIKQLTLSVCLITSILLNALGQSETTFLSYPTLSPDGKTIVFSYDGDLWRVASEGGRLIG